jgi:hypothetical protein
MPPIQKNKSTVILVHVHSIPTLTLSVDSTDADTLIKILCIYVTNIRDPYLGWDKKWLTKRGEEGELGEVAVSIKSSGIIIISSMLRQGEEEDESLLGEGLLIRSEFEILLS